MVPCQVPARLDEQSAASAHIQTSGQPECQSPQEKISTQPGSIPISPPSPSPSSPVPSADLSLNEDELQLAPRFVPAATLDLYQAQLQNMVPRKRTTIDDVDPDTLFAQLGLSMGVAPEQASSSSAPSAPSEQKPSSPLQSPPHRVLRPRKKQETKRQQDEPGEEPEQEEGPGRASDEDEDEEWKGSSEDEDEEDAKQEDKEKPRLVTPKTKTKTKTNRKPPKRGRTASKKGRASNPVSLQLSDPQNMKSAWQRATDARSLIMQMRGALYVAPAGVNMIMDIVWLAIALWERDPSVSIYMVTHEGSKLKLQYESVQKRVQPAPPFPVFVNLAATPMMPAVPAGSYVLIPKAEDSKASLKIYKAISQQGGHVILGLNNFSLWDDAILFDLALSIDKNILATDVQELIVSFEEHVYIQDTERKPCAVFAPYSLEKFRTHPQTWSIVMNEASPASSDGVAAILYDQFMDHIDQKLHVDILFMHKRFDNSILDKMKSNHKITLTQGSDHVLSGFASWNTYQHDLTLRSTQGNQRAVIVDYIADHEKELEMVFYWYQLGPGLIICRSADERKLVERMIAKWAKFVQYTTLMNTDQNKKPK